MTIIKLKDLQKLIANPISMNQYSWWNNCKLFLSFIYKAITFIERLINLIITLNKWIP